MCSFSQNPFVEMSFGVCSSDSLSSCFSFVLSLFFAFHTFIFSLPPIFLFFFFIFSFFLWWLFLVFQLFHFFLSKSLPQTSPFSISLFLVCFSLFFLFLFVVFLLKFVLVQFRGCNNCSTPVLKYDNYLFGFASFFSSVLLLKHDF